jgi:hypothetical protein
MPSASIAESICNPAGAVETGRQDRCAGSFPFTERVRIARTAPAFE